MTLETFKALTTPDEGQVLAELARTIRGVVITPSEKELNATSIQTKDGKRIELNDIPTLKK